MIKSTGLSISFSEMQQVLPYWTLDDIAVFEKMIVMTKYSKRSRVVIVKKALQRELRLGRRALDKSLDRLTRAGLIALIEDLTYKVAEIPVIIEEYYGSLPTEDLEKKLRFYLERSSGRFNITDASK